MYPSKLPLYQKISIPKCNTCKYNLKINSKSYCKLFKFFTIPYNVNHYVETEVARNDEELCGFYGKYFKEH